MALPEKRWIQRFDNYLSVLRHLENFAAIREARPLSVAEEFAVLKAFELVFESAWNMLKDYLTEQGAVDIHGSRDAIRAAFRVGIIENGEIWFDMIKSRNTTSHAYDEATAQEVSFVVSNEYIKEFGKLKAKFENYRQDRE
ncbi:MAG: nucleotidyltransferase substrate binding protein [Acidobacteriota bacterium]|jgi:nucleotidyltransferase substrate binding protein (TIGR01987 family)|nr:nucleotidyltransferase substrate binding protein [Acidobacteriota bacterium]